MRTLHSRHFGSRLSNKNASRLRVFTSITCLAALTGCAAVGPNYSRPSAPAPPAFREPAPEYFKEAAAAGWKQATPGDAYEKGRWWEIYNDPDLNALEVQVSVSNQNVIQAEAQFQQARAAIRVARADLYPTIGGSGTITNERFAGSSSASGLSAVRNVFSLPVSASWAPDLWGSIRRNITANVEFAQSQQANIENTRLLLTGELAQDYFTIRGIDADSDLLNRTIESYAAYLTLTRNRFQGGVASDLDVAQAESQLETTQSILIDLGVQRLQSEHAIAILIGKSPSELTIPPRVQILLPPAVPVGVPAELLQRRPDIAIAERHVAAANEQIGIALAAFYPNVTLSGTAGLQGSSLVNLFTWPSRIWSVGPGLSETLFDAGRRRGVVVEQQAAYDATVAAYRQTVLTALQQVEDQLAALRVLEAESAKVDQATEAANRELTVSTAQYRAGTTSYLNVITAQAVLLSSQRTALALVTRRMLADVLLVEAVGGGWNVNQLPTAQDLTAQRAPAKAKSASN